LSYHNNDGLNYATEERTARQYLPNNNNLTHDYRGSRSRTETHTHDNTVKRRSSTTDPTDHQERKKRATTASQATDASTSPTDSMSTAATIDYSPLWNPTDQTVTLAIKARIMGQLLLSDPLQLQQLPVELVSLATDLNSLRSSMLEICKFAFDVTSYTPTNMKYLLERIHDSITPPVIIEQNNSHELTSQSLYKGFARSYEAYQQFCQTTGSLLRTLHSHCSGTNLTTDQPSAQFDNIASIYFTLLTEADAFPRRHNIQDYDTYMEPSAAEELHTGSDNNETVTNISEHVIDLANSSTDYYANFTTNYNRTHALHALRNNTTLRTKPKSHDEDESFHAFISSYFNYLNKPLPPSPSDTSDNMSCSSDTQDDTPTDEPTPSPPVGDTADASSQPHEFPEPVVNNLFFDSHFDQSKNTQYNGDHFTLPSSYQDSHTCQALAAAITLLRDPSVLKGQLSHVRTAILARAHIYNATQRTRMNNTIRAFAAKANINLSVDDPQSRTTPYNLTRLPLSHRKRSYLRRKLHNGDHLSPEAAFHSSLSSLHLTPTSAVLDSGATKHFISAHLQHRLSNLRPMSATMYNANGGRTDLTLGGDFSVPLHNKQGQIIGSLPLNDISVIPDASFNLLSLTQLFKAGATFTLSAFGSFLHYKDNNYPLRLHNGLIIIDLNKPLIATDNNADIQFANFAECSTPDVLDNRTAHHACMVAAAPLHTWHERLGHASIKRLAHLCDSGTALGMNVTGKTTHNAQCTCETCMKTNNISASITSTRVFADTVARRGQVITTDVLGPFPTSIEGYRYAISFTDEFSRYSVVFLLRQKSDAAAAVDSLARYYKSLNILISEIRHDMGGEFGGTTKETIGRGGPVPLPTSILHKDIYTNEFKSACRRNGIISTTMPAYKPQLHGIAERWNKTVMTMANSMMYNARISPILWCAAISHANNIRNHLPTRSRGGLTPQELFTNRRPRYENFRIWGSYCYKKLPKCRKLPGLAVRKRLIYLGDSTDGIGFRCFDPLDYKFSTEFELIFDETSVAKRSTLLEAFDNRRKIIGNKDTIEDIPIVSDFDHDQHDERQIFTTYKDAHRDHTLNNPDNTTTNTYTTTTQAHPVLNEIQSLEKNSDLINRSATSKSKASKHTQSVTPNQLQGDSSPVTVTESTDHSTTTPQQHSDYGIRSESTIGPHCSIQPIVKVRGNGQIRGNQERQLQPIPECDLDDAAEHYDDNEFNSINNHENTTEDITVQSPFRNTLFNQKGTEFDINTNDDADQHGPLSDGFLNKELPLHEYDLTPGQLSCPIRQLPFKKAEKKHPDLMQFLKLAEQENLPLEYAQTNPKTGDSGDRYNIYKRATSILDYYNICRLNNLPKSRQDIEHDFLRGFVTFPQNTKKREENTHFACVVLTEENIPDHKDITTSINPTQSAFHDLVHSLWPHDPYASDAEIDAQNQQCFATVIALLVEEQLKLPSTPEPTSYAKAIDPNNPERLEWLAAIKRELDTLLERNTWSYIDRQILPRGRKPIRCKYVFKRKFNKDGTIQYKARLVACGVTQRAGLDYSSDELYASVCSYSSMRFLMSLATQKRMLLYQTDIQGAYLESYLDDEIYMHVPDGIDGHSNQYCRLIRGLYGCKQSGWAWSECFKEFMTHDPAYNMNFTPMTGEPNLYRRAFLMNGQKEEVIVGQYVDDCLVAATSQAALDWYMNNLKQRFPVNPKSSGFITKENPGLLLSMQVAYDRENGTLQFHQQRAIEALAHKFELHDTHPVLLPIKPDLDLPKLTVAEDPTFPTKFLSMIGSCLHICQVSRPDCSFAVGLLARHSATPGKAHMKAAEDLIRYMYHTREYCIQYTATDNEIANVPYIFEKSHHPDNIETLDWAEDLSKEYKLRIPPRTIEERLEAGHTPDPHSNHPITYIDANLGGDKTTRKSTSGLVIMMNGGPIAWSSRLQKLCAQSSAEAEIIAVVDSVKEALHIKLLSEESGIRPPDIPMEVHEDNNACIHMAHNLRGSQQAKHYELRLRFLNEHVLERNIEFSRVDTTQQLADGFTKPLALPNFRIFRNWMLCNTRTT